MANPPPMTLHGFSKSIPTFKYEPLASPQSSLRIVSLQPRTQSGTVEASLEHVTFASRPKYVALSYAWGPPTETRTIFIDGQKLEVRKNLFDALLHLRDKTENKTLWIDAICIDQSNIEERNQQVRLMAYIYTRAKHVVVWLGKLFLEGSVSSSSQPEWKIVCKQPYWQRLWIVQEIGAASKIMVKWDEDTGEQSTVSGISRKSRSFSYTWEDFFKNSMNYEEDSPLPRKLYEQRQRRHGDGFLLANLMQVSQDSLCEDPRDKIYGLMGIAHDCQDGSFPLDYSKSLFEVYADAMTFHQKAAAKDESKEFVDVVSFSHLVYQMLGGQHSLMQDLQNRNVKVIPLHQQSKATLADINQTLSVAGISFGYITQLGPSYEAMLGEPAAWNTWKALLSKCETDLPELRKRNEHFLRVLVDLEEKDLGKIRPVITRFMFKMNQRLMRELHRTEEASPGVLSGGVVPVAGGILVDKTNPRLFATKKGVIGLVPGNTREGDFLVQFLATDVVAVARCPSANSPFCQIIGRAVIANPNEDSSTTFQVLSDSDRLIQVADHHPMDFQNKTVELKVDMMTLYNLTC